MPSYSIIIPVFNEVKSVNALLKGLSIYSNENHEIIIINDGSIDGTKEILSKSNFINLISFKDNQGKGCAIQQGIKLAKNNKILIYDGDMELDPKDIKKLMILDENIRFVMGYRFKRLNPIKSNFDWGNFMFTSFFNIIFKTNHRDILCCAKAFYLSDLKGCSLSESCFDIDVELSSILTVRNKNTKIDQIYLEYNRRSVEDGKKLKVSDGWKILNKIINMARYL